MLMERIPSRLDWTRSVTVRLLRRWAAARDAEQPPLPSMVRLAGDLGMGPQVAVALASMFQLTEACLGRPLVAECCCSTETGPDEQALLMMLAVAPEPGQPGATSAIPHGLPGALAWAIASVRRLVGDEAALAVAKHPGRCPFMGGEGMAA